MKAVTRKSGRLQTTARKTAHRKAAFAFEQLEPRAMMSASHVVAPVLSATPISGSQINLTWNRIAGAGGYRVDELVHGSWKQIANLSSGSGSFKVGGLQSGMTYEFEVGAHNASSNAWSNSTSATTLSRPVAPSLSLTAVSSTEIDLSWNSASGATGYLVNEWNGKSWVRIANLSGGATSYAVIGLKANTTYYIDVAAYNSIGTTLATSQSALTFPNAPTLAATAVSSSEVDLVWNAVSGANGYVVDEWNGSGWMQIAEVAGGSTAHAVTGLNAATTYYVEVGAYNASGTSMSAQQSATTFAGAPDAPNFTATPVSTSEIDLSWSSTAGATGYLVDEWNGSSWVQIAVTDGNTTFYAVTGLNANTTYCFEVGAYNSFGTSMAASQSAMTLNGGPAAPTFTATPVSNSEIDLSWNSVSDASGYLVYKWDGSSWNPIADVDSSTTFYAVIGLNAGTTYYFELAAYNSASTTWTNWLSADTLGGNKSSFDNPTADVGYSNVTGTLFGGNGPSYLDVQQGAVGDCWLMASLAEVAVRDPSDIQGMFTYKGTGTDNGDTVSVYSVRLYDTSGAAHSITVDTELPYGGEYYDQVTNGVLWVALAEKAYAEANGMGWVETQYVGQDSYSALNGGYPSWALQAITGKSANDFAINPTDAAAAWNSGEFVVLCTTASPSNAYIVGDHAYAMLGYNASSSTPFTMYNPWGTDANGDGWYDGLYDGHQVYGKFNASAATIAANFDLESFGSRAQVGAANLGGGLQTSSTALGNNATTDGIAGPTQLGHGQHPAQSLNSGVQSQFAVDNLFADWSGNEDYVGSEMRGFASRLDFLNETLLDHCLGNLDVVLVD
jgi:Calpain family cysteine protease/Fibronectin type III domain